jgi:hypothetical protein
MSALVRIHRDQELVFPSACLVCGMQNPASELCLARWCLAANVFKWRKIMAPACNSCASRFRRMRLIRTIWMIVGIAAVFAAMAALDKVWNPLVVGLVASVVFLNALGVV